MPLVFLAQQHSTDLQALCLTPIRAAVTLAVSCGQQLGLRPVWKPV